MMWNGDRRLTVGVAQPPATGLYSLLDSTVPTRELVMNIQRWLVAVLVGISCLLLGVSGCTRRNQDNRKGGVVARIDIEIIDVRKSPPVPVKKETLELPISHSTDKSVFPYDDAEQPEPFCKIICHLAAISDVKFSIPTGTWPYEIVRDKKANYHLLKGGVSIHTWSATDETAVLDGALPVLKTDLAHRAAEYRKALLARGETRDAPK
jgi:hypothetical protein